MSTDGAASAATRPGGPEPEIPAGLDGLTTAEVERRRAAGQGNDVPPSTSRTTWEIIRANLFTRFNAILVTLWAVIIVIGPFQDALFGIIIVSNTGVGVIQEIRARRTLDRLAIVAAPEVRVRRDGGTSVIDPAQLVFGDVFEMRSGEQVPVDGDVCRASGLELDESLLTGEAEPEAKQAGDQVLSGSYVVAGHGWAEASAVGGEAYANRLAIEARRFSLLGSELRAGIDQILRWVTWILPPTAVVLVIGQIVAHENNALRESLRGAVAGVVNMVPEGLVLLTSVAFAVGVVRLANAKVLAQELAAIEGLARVDVVCVDKTGTLTLGRIHLVAIDDLTADGSAPVGLAALLAADPAPNASARAITEGQGASPVDPAWVVTKVVAFSSDRKWSGAGFEGRGALLLGGADVLLAVPMASGAGPEASRVAAEKVVEGHLAEGRRVLVLARAPAAALDELRPHDLELMAVIALEEELRPDAADTVRYFLDQGVQLKVISGDDARTVGGVATRVGVPGADQPVDARTLSDDPDELAEVMATKSVFGRVTPHQKRAMVGALQARGHTVAMTGDGVNDVLALKDADMGVAMGSGSAASRSVARLVLLDDSWASLPFCVAEGRRVIANVERVANLFVTKTVYATVLALVIAVFGVEFPFLPRHLTIVSSLTIGVPAFFLALSPATGPATTGFARRVLSFAAPAGVIAASTVLIAYWLARSNIETSSEAGLHEAQTVSLIVLFGVAMGVLGLLSRPFTPRRYLLVGSMLAAFGAIMATPPAREFLALELPSANMTAVCLGLIMTALVALKLLDGIRPNPGNAHRPTRTRPAPG